MQVALALAGRGLGRVWPNPAVGCVIVRDGLPVGRGWTQPGGRPHAETEALARAGERARGATAYVSFEPCCHHGATPPCTDALIRAGIARLVTTMPDPDPRVAGRGLAQLSAAGIAIDCGLMEQQAQDLNAGFISRISTGRPLVALKLATTLDGRIATRGGASKWITGELARQRAHLLRARYDGVMIGSGTALADDPALTCRLPGLAEHSPVRIVVDSRLRLPPTAQLAVGAGAASTWCLTCSVDEGRRAALSAAGVKIVDVAAGEDGRVDLGAALSTLGSRGLTRLLVEGGKELATSLLGAGLVDRVYWFRAPKLTGDDGLPAVASLGIENIEALACWTRIAVQPLGEDLLETYTVPT